MLTDLLIARARAASSSLSGAARAVLVNLESLMGDSSNGEPLFGSLGIVARPKPPRAPTPSPNGLAPAGECEVVCLKEGDGLQPIACRDLRINTRVQPVEGEIMLAGYEGGYFSVRAATGNLGSRLAMYAPRLNGGGVEVAAHSLVLDPHPAATSPIALTHAGGYSIRITNDGNTEVRNNLIVAPDLTPQPVVLFDNLNAWRAEVNAYLAALKLAVEGVGGSVVGAPPSTSPVGSSHLSAAP